MANHHDIFGFCFLSLLMLQVIALVQVFNIIITKTILDNLSFILKPCPEAVVQRCSVKKVFLEISQNCARVSFLIKLQAEAATLFKKRLWRRCFPGNFAKFLKAPFLTEQLRWLLLPILSSAYPMPIG